jgi:hypothetical protein
MPENLHRVGAILFRVSEVLAYPTGAPQLVEHKNIFTPNPMPPPDVRAFVYPVLLAAELK